MPGKSLRIAAVYCLAIWVAVWVVFMAIRFLPVDIRVIPGIGPIMLLALVVALAAPVVAAVAAGASVIREPRARLNWLTLGAALCVLFGQVMLFAATKWM